MVLSNQNRYTKQILRILYIIVRFYIVSRSRVFFWTVMAENMLRR